MNSTPTDRQIRQCIDTFLSEVSALVKSTALEAVVNVLGEAGAAPQRRATRKARASKPAKPRGKRSSEDVLAMGAALLEYIVANPGQRLEQIGAALNTPTREFKLPIQKLLEAKSIHTQGKRRGTKYFPGGQPAEGAKKATGAKKAKGAKRARRRAKKA